MTWTMWALGVSPLLIVTVVAVGYWSGWRREDREHRRRLRPSTMDLYRAVYRGDLTPDEAARTQTKEGPADE
jgi:hypothetical protein